MELLHAYYAQLFHIISAFPGLGSFGKYITVGTSNQPGRDLGFHYLRPGLVAAAFREQLGRDRVFSINMKDLFSPGMIHLGRWHPDFHDLPLGNMDVENKRTVANDVKIAHIRPIWVKRIPFKLIPFLKEMRSVYLKRYASHAKLEVPITLTEPIKEQLNHYFQRPIG